MFYVLLSFVLTVIVSILVLFSYVGCYGGDFIIERFKYLNCISWTYVIREEFHGAFFCQDWVQWLSLSEALKLWVL